MRYASLIWKSGLIGALMVALFVGCKKEKEQNGPSLTVAGDPGVVTGDRTSPPGTYPFRFKLIAQKGSGKDDADLKEYTITGTNNIVNVRRSAPNGQSFTIDTTMEITGSNNQSYTITFTVTDKNDKSVSRSFRITFRDTTTEPGPVLIVDTLYNGNYTNQSDGKGTHLRYDVSSSSSPLSLQNRTQADNNPSQILFVYFYSTPNNTPRHSVISPAILRDQNYNNTPVEWDNPSTLTTNFRIAPSNVNFATAGHADIVSAYNNGTLINNEFPGNADQRAECIDGRILAFKQGNIYGLIRVDNVTSGGPGATLSVKVARP